jgi:hypothetical protein
MRLHKVNAGHEIKVNWRDRYLVRGDLHLMLIGFLPSNQVPPEVAS